jgi:hypothetical protein
MQIVFTDKRARARARARVCISGASPVCEHACECRLQLLELGAGFCVRFGPGGARRAANRPRAPPGECIFEWNLLGARSRREGRAR